MIISIASGKGGTGKTTISTSLSLSIANSVTNSVQLLDCDAEEPNAHIFIKPDVLEKHPVVVPIPKVDAEKCTLCGKCTQVCAFNAIAVIPGRVLVFPELCHNCGSCKYFCPAKAIDEINKKVGIIEIGQKSNLQFIHGKLNIGEVIPTPVIKVVKTHIDNAKTVIIDAPPGTSCPVIEAVKGSDFCILVTEPTPFGLNDLILTVEVLRKMQIPFGVVINRSDLGDNKTEQFCKKENISILMRIPFKKEIAIAYSQGIPLIKVFPEYEKQFCDLFDKIRK
ncbi:MAG: ATP-binding protein [Gammaproteobacteria bacterium]|jgi:MinD superfamily P-loop ATPase